MMKNPSDFTLLRVIAQIVKYGLCEYTDFTYFKMKSYEARYLI